MTMENHFRQCDTYWHFKQKVQNAELNPIETTHPLEIVHIDCLTIESGKSNMLIFWSSQTTSLDMLRHFSLNHKQLKLHSNTVGEIFCV